MRPLFNSVSDGSDKLVLEAHCLAPDVIGAPVPAAGGPRRTTSTVVEVLTLDGAGRQFARVRAAGVLNSADYRQFEAWFNREIENREIPFPLLLDLRGFRGWTLAGLLRDVRFDVRNRSTFSQIAVVGDRGWHRWLTHAAVPIFKAEVKFFAAADLQQAEEWLSRSLRQVRSERGVSE